MVPGAAARVGGAEERSAPGRARQRASSTDSWPLSERSERSERSEFGHGPGVRAPQGSRRAAPTADVARRRAGRHADAKQQARKQADARSARRPSHEARSARRTPSMNAVAFLTRTRGQRKLHWTDWLSYAYLAVGLFLMFGPVLWLVMSSFKTESALSEFPPSLLPYGQKSVAVPGEDGLKPVYRVKLPDGAEAAPDAAKAIGERVIAAVKADYPDARVDGNDTVSGKVAGEFRNQAILALLAAMAAVSVYIWVRFEWQFGVGAMFALVHDVSITLGLFALTQWEFSLQIVAAILAIIGYSLNDTIVVYDRIRENLKKFRKMEMGALLDLSVNETLARTVMTSLTLFIALIPLLIFGPPSLFGMVAAITVGLFVGTYSSIYMAGPLLIWMGVTTSSFVPTETALDKQERLAKGQG